MTEEIRKVWDVELDLLHEFDRVCKLHGLTYYASCGTLLGAVRHHGFIPWDDDIDLFLMWPDYQRLMELASESFQYPYFYQSIYSEPDAMPNACRLRRSDKTGFTKWEYENAGREYNKGIFIDVFPLFYVPDTEEERLAQKENVIHLWECIRGYGAWKLRENGRPIPQDYDKYIPVFLELWRQNGEMPDATRLKENYLLACASCAVRSREVGATSSKCHQKNLMWNTEWFDTTIDLPFENTTIPCPGEYVKVLEKQYGDWRTPVRGGAMHEMMAIDPDLPWEKFDMRSIEQILEKEEPSG